MTVAPAVFLFEALVDDVQPGGTEPAGYLVTARVVVVAGDIAVDDFAAYRREPAPGELCECFLDGRLGLLLDGQDDRGDLA